MIPILFPLESSPHDNVQSAETVSVTTTWWCGQRTWSFTFTASAALSARYHWVRATRLCCRMDSCTAVTMWNNNWPHWPTDKSHPCPRTRFSALVRRKGDRGRGNVHRTDPVRLVWRWRIPRCYSWTKVIAWWRQWTRVVVESMKQQRNWD